MKTDQEKDSINYSLAILGAHVLDILESHEEWDSDTTSDIATFAMSIGLADVVDDKFKDLTKPHT